jgi:predicted transcriptional regulator
MDIQALKIELAQKILESNRADLLQKIDQLFKTESNNDWWEELPVEIQDSIILGLREAETGDLLTHEQVVTEARERYGY